MGYLLDTAQGLFPLSKTDWEDWSGNGYFLTAGGTAPTLATGFRGLPKGATLFSGSNYLYIADASAANLKITGPITVSAWVYPTTIASAGNYAVARKLGTGGNSYALMVYGSSSGVGVARFFIQKADNSGYINVQSITTFPINAWTHIVGTYDGTTIKIYINGNYDNSIACPSGPYNSTANFTIGASSGGGSYFIGRIDEVGVFNSLLAATDIANLYAYHEQFLPVGSVSGILKDKTGGAINASTYNVRANAYLLGNTNTAPMQSSLITAVNGAWSMNTLPQWRKHLISFEYQGSYTPTGETNIAGAEYLVAI